MRRRWIRALVYGIIVAINQRKGASVEPRKYSKYITRAKFDKGPFGHPRLHYHSGDRGGDVNFGVSWNLVTTANRVPDKPHVHTFDEVWIFMGSDMTNARDFDAEIEVYLGEEGEKYVIKRPTVLEIPRGLVHCPLIFKKVNKPVLFVNLPLTPKYKQKKMKRKDADTKKKTVTAKKKGTAKS
jgi:hypothetical protein